MSKVSGNPTPTDKIIHRLRLMAESGGMLTRDRILTVMDAADRLEIYSERIAIMSENEPLPKNAMEFPPGGDANEKH